MRTIVATVCVETYLDVLVEVEDAVYDLLTEKEYDHDDLDYLAEAGETIERAAREALDNLDAIVPNDHEFKYFSSAKTLGGRTIFEN